MKGILLVNMGSPSSQKEMREFLFNMFSDKAILPLPFVLRKFLAFVISTTRYKNSWKKYELIGGSPLIGSMAAMNTSLSKMLGANFDVFTAYSYSSPSIKNGIDYFAKKGIEQIKVLSMYPQTSITTTVSVKRDVDNARKKYSNLSISMVGAYYQEKQFIHFWTDLISETLTQKEYNNPTLLFSAHAIPAYLVEQGDSYVTEIEESARLIAKELNLPYKVSYQSKIGKLKWVGPDTMALMEQMKAEDYNEIVIVPISFINENLETLYDLDTEIIPHAQTELKIKQICRVHIPPVHPAIIESFKNIIS